MNHLVYYYNAIQSKSPQKKCPSLKKHFESHFNTDRTKLKMPTGIEHMPIYIQSSKSVFKTNNNKPSDKEVKKAIKKLRNNKESFDIEAELLKIADFLSEFNNKFHYFLKEVWNQKCIPQKWGLSHINALWKQKGSPQDPHIYRGISIGYIMVNALMNILTMLSLFYESELLISQHGFCSGNRCNGDTYIIRQLQETVYLLCQPHSSIWPHQ